MTNFDFVIVILTYDLISDSYCFVLDCEFGLDDVDCEFAMKLKIVKYFEKLISFF